ncbi:MAG: NHL repeat-containing protein [Candidatus Wallbacteria bacterium]|nr:NHL repeat-containing protein [Candidatus Wallbacteria bacterium]
MNCLHCGSEIPMPDFIVDGDMIYLIHRGRRFLLDVSGEVPVLVGLPEETLQPANIPPDEGPAEELILKTYRGRPSDSNAGSLRREAARHQRSQSEHKVLKNSPFQDQIIENRGRNYLLATVDSGNHRSQCLNTSGQVQLFFGGQGSSPGRFCYPKKILRDRDCGFWITDSRNCRIQKFTATGEFEFEFGKQGSEPGEFSYLSGIFCHQERIFVADTLNHRLQIFSREGELIGIFGSFGEATGRLNRPYGIVVENDGTIWVTELGNHRVQRFSPDGEGLSTISSFGRQDECLNSPAGLALHGDELVVADSGNHRVKRFSRTGKFLKSYGQGGCFNTPMDVAFEPEGEGLWVADSWNHRLVRLGPGGEVTSTIGGFGRSPGLFDTPTSMVIF